MTSTGGRVEFSIPRRADRRRKKPVVPNEPVPRIARLLALAHKWEGMVRRGEVKDYAEIARFMGLSRARVTQICSLVLLAPRIQEPLLTLGVSSAPICERRIREVLDEPSWTEQELLRAKFYKLLES